MKYILGIDQGSSKTYAILGDENGNILGFGKSHGGCHSDTGIDYAMSAVSEAAFEALREAKVSKDQVTAVVAGMAGADWKHEILLLETALKDTLLMDNIMVVNDCIIAMRTGLTKQYGAVLCAGSGLNCAVRDGTGREFVYGFYIDEEYQGGSGLGRAGVKAVILTELGMGEATVLKDAVLNQFGCSNVEELLYKKVTGKITNRDYLQLPLILENAAESGDKEARKILFRFGVQFGQYVTSALKKMNLLDLDLEVVLSGSIFKCRQPELKQGVESQLKVYAPKAYLVDAVYEPIIGAYLMGLDKETAIGQEQRNNLDKGCDWYHLRRTR